MCTASKPSHVASWLCRYWRDMGFTVSWDAQDSMLLSFTAPAVRKDPATGQDLWFNSAVGVTSV